MSVSSDLNYIKRIQSYPCHIPDGGLSLAFDAAVNAAIVGVVTYTRFDCDDILVERARLGIKGEGPFGLGEHGLSPHGGHRGVNPGGMKRWNPTVSAGNSFLFDNIIAPARFIGSGLFVFGIAIHTYALWTSMMYAGYNCDQPSRTVSGSSSAATPFVYIGPRKQEVPLLGVFVQDCCIVSNGPTMAIAPGCQASMSFAANWEPPAGEPGTEVFMWIEDDYGYVSPASSFDPANSKDGKGATHTFTDRVGSKPFVGNALRLMLEMPGSGAMVMTNSYANWYCSGLGAHLLPAGGCPKGPAIG